MPLRANMGLWAPHRGLSDITSWNNNSLVIDAAGEKAAAIFQVPKTGSITDVYFGVNTVTTGQTLRAGLYTVDGSGNPTTTPYTGGAHGTVACASTDDNFGKRVTFGTAYSGTAGDIVALVIEFDSTVGNLQVRYSSGVAQAMPYVSLFTASWAKSTFAPVFALKYSDGTYPAMPQVLPFIGQDGVGTTTGITTLALNSGTSPDEVAVKFTAPFPCRLVGIGGIFSLGAGMTFELNVYTGTTADAAMLLTLDSDHASGTSSRAFMYTFPGTQTLRKGDVRYLAIKALAASPSITAYRGVADSAAMMEAYHGVGQLVRAHRTDLGAWTEVLNETFVLYPIVDQIDDGAYRSGRNSTVLGGNRW